MNIFHALEAATHVPWVLWSSLFAAALPSYPDDPQEELVVTGEVPSALNPPPGCHFHPRCPFVLPHCSLTEPELREISPRHYVACHLY